MPLNVSIATSYVIEFVQSLFVLNGEIFRVIAENDTLVDRSIEGIYYFFGFLNYFSDFFRDFTNVVASNETLMNYSVVIWQKVAKNATYVFGDYDANYGIAYVWRLGYECIQSGNTAKALLR